MEQHPSDSKVQRDIETEMCSDLEKQHPDWHRIDWRDLTTGRELAAKVKPDAVWRDDKGIIIIAECFARVGELKPGHRRKIATDVLKLISLRDEFGIDNPPRLLLVIPDEQGP
jgi:hypothetical protein